MTFCLNIAQTFRKLKSWKVPWPPQNKKSFVPTVSRFVDFVFILTFKLKIMIIFDIFKLYWSLRYFLIILAKGVWFRAIWGFDVLGEGFKCTRSSPMNEWNEIQFCVFTAFVRVWFIIQQNLNKIFLTIYWLFFFLLFITLIYNLQNT